MRPHRLQQSETKRILERANRYLARTKLKRQSAASRRWIVILFVQIHTSSGHNDVDTEAHALRQYQQQVEQQISACGGYIIGEGENMTLAMFSSDTAESVVQSSIDTAVKLMNRLAAQNKQRLAQDLIPFRIGMGLDSNAVSICSQTAQIETWSGLEACIRQARSLCDLNRQTPFPAIFISQNTAAWLNGQQRYTIQNLGDVTVQRTGEPLAVYALMPGESAREM